MGGSLRKCCYVNKATIDIKPNMDKKAILFDEVIDISTTLSSENSEVNVIPTNVDKSKIIEKFKKRVISGKYLDAMYLIETYPDFDLTSLVFDNGNNVLHYSIEHKQSKFLLFLIQHGTDINIQNTKTLDSALHISVLNESEHMTTLLLRNHANPNITNMYGQTPLDIAVSNDNSELIHLLTNDDIRNIYLDNMPSHNVIYGINISEEFKDLYENEIKYDTDDEITSPRNTINVNNIVTRTRTRGVSAQPMFNNNPSMTTINEDSSQAGGELETVPLNTPFNFQNINPRVYAVSVSLSLKRSYSDDVNLKIYQGWIYKRTGNSLLWYKRYLCIKDGYMLWNDKRIKVTNETVIDKSEKKKWKKCTSLLFVKENGINIIETRNKDEFIFEVKALTHDTNVKSKKYAFKCFKKTDLDYWLNGFITHIDALKSQYT